MNQKKYQHDGEPHHGHYLPRVWIRKGRGTKSTRFLVKCGCCDKSFDMYVEPEDDFIEINGVMMSKRRLVALLAEVGALNLDPATTMNSA